MRSRKMWSVVLACAMALSLAACGGSKGSGSEGSVSGSSGSGAAATDEDPNVAAADGTLELTDWEKSSGIFKTDETDDELYEAAKKEGKLTVYSISSRIPKVVEAFEKAYPGIEVEPFDIATNELLEKVSREYEAGQHVADVIHIKDEDGSLYNEYVKARKFYNYKPADIFSHIDASGQEEPVERKTTSPYRQTYDILAVAVPGELSEWPKEHDWKSCIRLKRILGSNPRLSARMVQWRLRAPLLDSQYPTEGWQSG